MDNLNSDIVNHIQYPMNAFEKPKKCRMKTVKNICYICLLLTFSGCNNSKKLIEDSLVYKQNTVAFINELHAGADSNFILSNVVDSLPEVLMTVLENEKNFLTGNEKELIKMYAYPRVDCWTAAFFPNMKIIDGDSLRKVETGLTPQQLLEHSVSADNKKVHCFAYPIFLRNYTYCLFYSSTRTINSGAGSMSLYKKERGRWKAEKFLWHWII